MALLVNFGLSGYLILDKRYAGRTSIIGLLSNTFLCLGKVYAYRTCVPVAAHGAALCRVCCLSRARVDRLLRCAGWPRSRATWTWR